MIRFFIYVGLFVLPLVLLISFFAWMLNLRIPFEKDQSEPAINQDYEMIQLPELPQFDSHEKG